MLLLLTEETVVDGRGGVRRDTEGSTSLREKGGSRAVGVEGRTAEWDGLREAGGVFWRGRAEGEDGRVGLTLLHALESLTSCTSGGSLLLLKDEGAEETDFLAKGAKLGAEEGGEIRDG